MKFLIAIYITVCIIFINFINANELNKANTPPPLYNRRAKIYYRYVGNLSFQNCHVGRYSNGCVAICEGDGGFIFHRDWTNSLLDEDVRKRGFGGLAADPNFVYDTWNLLLNNGAEEFITKPNCGDFWQTHICGTIGFYTTENLINDYATFTNILQEKYFVRYGDTQVDPIRRMRITGSSSAKNIVYFSIMFSAIIILFLM
jgi:hypothetical protein